MTGLLSNQLRDHRIAIADDALVAAVDGVFADEQRGFFLVARHDERTIGVTYVSFTWSLEHGGKSAWLEELYVLPDCRDRGVGASLMDALLAEARARGCAAIDLEVDTEHARAANLYARYGFSPHSRSRWFKILADRDRDR